MIRKIKTIYQNLCGVLKVTEDPYQKKWQKRNDLSSFQETRKRTAITNKIEERK